ncbi:MAG: methyltransferase type 11 [Deltaproteobacteria bacterium RIFOXYD12_FULL_57_12]|nr:MAG: methyltransferase type 11 [Deltaproteobacteria bacterium RIFOXYD12_FULL_57_12]
MNISRHNDEIHRNLRAWGNKPVLREIYRSFHRLISEQLVHGPDSRTVELGSGIGNIKEVIPNCIRTDLFPNPWIDRVENAYNLSFQDDTVANVILFDMFHHLRYPGTALREVCRVLIPGGRLIVFDPCMSLLGWIIYGLFHHESLGLLTDIRMFAPPRWSHQDDIYYAAQGNASRIFRDKSQLSFCLPDMLLIRKQRISAISYVASGGYSKPQLYPDALYPAMQLVDRICDFVPCLFATRLLVVMEKKQGA